MKRRIAILFHEIDRNRKLSKYLLYHLVAIWRETGYEIEFVFGPRNFIPADVGILHIDLSVVPEAYLDLARRYPVAVNLRAADIRKSTFSRNLVQPGDGWTGEVIVKSDLNYAGKPERDLRQRLYRARLWPLRRLVEAVRDRFPRKGPGFRSAQDYRIYPSRSEVPQADFSNLDLVVERFLPERRNGMYYVHTYHFLGDRETCTLTGSDRPIVSSENLRSRERVDPHPDIIAMRHELGFDYGKFDYVMHDGQPVLLDINKTTGVGTHERTPDRVAAWRHRAGGIEAFFD